MIKYPTIEILLTSLTVQFHLHADAVDSANKSCLSNMGPEERERKKLEERIRARDRDRNGERKREMGLDRCKARKGKAGKGKERRRLALSACSIKSTRAKPIKQ